MPTYYFHCDHCDAVFEQWHSIHDDHPATHTCGGTLEQVFTPPATFGIGAKGDTTRDATEREKQWNRDLPAYKRLVAQGYQPPRLDGCGDLEQTALGDFHIRSGLPYTDEMVASREEHVRQILRENA